MHSQREAELLMQIALTFGCLSAAQQEFIAGTIFDFAEERRKKKPELRVIPGLDAFRINKMFKHVSREGEN